ncbi:hypothetical protein RCCWILLIS_84 [Rhodobacter phage RcCWillis]|nr:hypothetical protein RCCWILLIS_84 [Rhodobacter phage RcCWillis]
MTKQAAPYTFPHKSRKAMIEYLMDRNSRGYHYQSYRFCWNVKAHAADFDGDTLRKHNADLDPAFDSRWDDVIENSESLFWSFCEDAARQINDDEWTSYPGDDQGDWEFLFAGRSGGWIVLNKFRGLDARELYSDPAEAADMRKAYCEPMHGAPSNLDCWPWERLKAFYRGIRTADSDFTPAKAAAEVEYQAAFYRETLEDEWKADRDASVAAEVAAIEASRPDLYPNHI